MKQMILTSNQKEIPISKLIVGTTYFGTSIDKQKVYNFLDYYYEKGGRTIDTARSYGQEHPREVSESEKVIGEWINDRRNREEITLITKGAFPPLEDLHNSRVNVGEIAKDLEDSLACLQTNYIDIYFLHRDDESADLEGIMRLLHGAVVAGKIRAIGASNWTIERMLEANEIAKKHNLTPFTIAEIQWSLALCDAESWGDDTLVFMTDKSYSTFKEHNIPVLAYASQGKGFFSQYVEKGATNISEKASRFLNETNIKRAEKVAYLSKEKGITPAQIALQYITRNPLSAAAIIGASNMAQLKDSLGSEKFLLSQDEIAWLIG